MTMLRFMLMTALLVLGLAARPADAAEPHIRPQLLSESATPAAGRTVTLAIVMTPEPGWHGYWKNPGDAGTETTIDWTLPAGARVGPLRYPLPRRLIVYGIMNHVHEGPFALLTDLEIPAGRARGTPLPIRARINWLACTDKICMPEKAELAMDLVVGDGAIDPRAARRFAAFRAKLPALAPGLAHFERRGTMLRIAVPLPDAPRITDPWFYAFDNSLIDHGAPQRISRRKDGLLIIEARARNFTGQVEGIVALTPDDGIAIVAQPGAVPAPGQRLIPPETPPAPPPATIGLILATLAAAILGGLLLNVMPCVFPILSLKAISLVRSGRAEKEARQEALAYAGGAILVCTGLGILLLLLRTGGAALGWAFQLQDPYVIALLLLLTTAIALNLAGVFELPALAFGAPISTSGNAGAFWCGALAAFIATPCTGPFMAGALGTALFLPPAAAIAVFFGLGLGLSLPFLAVGFVPSLRRHLPRPGPWMASFRSLLSVPMFATALGLAWILGRQAGVDAMATGLAAALVTGGGLWWSGARQRRGHARPWLPFLLTMAVATTLVVLIVPERPDRSAGAASRPTTDLPFSEARLDQLRAAGKPVFVYFTADWCLTCKVNEKTAIDRASVRQAFATAGVTVLVGDWTRGDPAIGRFLARQGRSGVPLYLFYPADGSPPQTLPQILTASRLVALAPQSR